MPVNIPFLLRPFEKEDCSSLAHHANSKRIWEGVRDVFPFPYTEKDAVNFIEYAIKTEREIVRAIDVKGQAVGAIGLHLKEGEQRLNGEIGYWIGIEYQGKGIVSKAIAEIVDMAFCEHNLLRVYAKVFSNNPASGRVLEKNGFKLEAKLEKAIIKEGRILDLLIFSKINDHFNPITLQKDQ